MTFYKCLATIIGVLGVKISMRILTQDDPKTKMVISDQTTSNFKSSYSPWQAATK